MLKDFCSKKKSTAAYKNLFWGTLFYVNIVRNQSQEAEFLESNLKRFKPLSKYAGHTKTLTIKWNCI